ncbi:MAG: hypothetical protein JW395_1287 [Nitrospira sp.]|nr:hypothetical protein [Nitrospira sp.]
MAKERTPTPTREQESRIKTWQPPSTLPDPAPSNGWVFRWVRTSTVGTPDPQNVSMRSREGWVPVRAEEHPEVAMNLGQSFGSVSAPSSGVIEIGGLILCKAPAEAMAKRAEYYRDLANKQMEGVDNNYLRQNDARMPLLRPERSSRTTFGSD